MVTFIGTGKARSLLKAGVSVLDVLPATSFAQEHIAGSVNLPLAEIGSAPARLDPARPLVVYCYDHQ